jgi:hypothetical protein
MRFLLLQNGMFQLIILTLISIEFFFKFAVVGVVRKSVPGRHRGTGERLRAASMGRFNSGTLLRFVKLK